MTDLSIINPLSATPAGPPTIVSEEEVMPSLVMSPAIEVLTPMENDSTATNATSTHSFNLSQDSSEPVSTPSSIIVVEANPDLTPIMTYLPIPINPLLDSEPKGPQLELSTPIASNMLGSPVTFPTTGQANPFRVLDLSTDGMPPTEVLLKAATAATEAKEGLPLLSAPQRIPVPASPVIACSLVQSDAPMLPGDSDMRTLQLQSHINVKNQDNVLSLDDPDAEWAVFLRKKLHEHGDVAESNEELEQNHGPILDAILRRFITSMSPENMGNVSPIDVNSFLCSRYRIPAHLFKSANRLKKFVRKMSHLILFEIYNQQQQHSDETDKSSCHVVISPVTEDEPLPSCCPAVITYDVDDVPQAAIDALDAIVISSESPQSEDFSDCTVNEKPSTPTRPLYRTPPTATMESQSSPAGHFPFRSSRETDESSATISPEPLSEDVSLEEAPSPRKVRKSRKRKGTSSIVEPIVKRKYTRSSKNTASVSDSPAETASKPKSVRKIKGKKRLPTDSLSLSDASDRVEDIGDIEAGTLTSRILNNIEALPCRQGEFKKLAMKYLDISCAGKSHGQHAWSWLELEYVYLNSLVDQLTKIPFARRHLRGLPSPMTSSFGLVPLLNRYVNVLSKVVDACIEVGALRNAMLPSFEQIQQLIPVSSSDDEYSSEA